MEKKILFIDSGDTLIDESTEVRLTPGGVVQTAELYPGAKEALLAIKERGYTIALVADGLKESFDRMYSQHGIPDIFAARAVSEVVGVEKPDARMFRTAMDLLGLTETDKPRIYMVGNNLKKDIVGANRFGIHSVLMAWSPRYDMVPKTSEETPEIVLQSPLDLLSLFPEE